MPASLRNFAPQAKSGHRSSPSLPRSSTHSFIYMNHIWFIYNLYEISTVESTLGIVKISDKLHDEIRGASTVMSRSINAQAEFWMRIGMLAELNPELNYNQLCKMLLRNPSASLETLTRE